MKKLFFLLTASIMAFTALAQSDADNEAEQPEWTITVTRQCKGTEDVVTNYTPEKQSVVVNHGNIHYIAINFEPVRETSEPSKFLIDMKYNLPNDNLNNPVARVTTYTCQPTESPVYEVACWLKDGKTLMSLHSSGGYKVCGTNVQGFASLIPTFDGELTTTYFNLFESGGVCGEVKIGTAKSYTSGILYANGTSFNRTNAKNSKLGVYSATLNFKNINIDIQPAKVIDIFVDKSATFIAPICVNIPAGIRAYASIGVDVKLPSAKLVLEELTEGIIPANTPVYLITADGSSAKYSFKISQDAEYIVDESSIGVVPGGTQHYFKDTNILEEGDSRDGAFAGVNMLHAVNTNEKGVTNYDNAYDYYVLEDGKFVRVKELDEKGKAINVNYVLEPFTCYVQLPNNEANPDEIAVYIPREDVLYLHFTDNVGNYASTHTESLIRNDDGSYSVTLKVPAKTTGDTEYFVLSDATLPAEQALSRAVDNTWAKLGTVYHAGSKDGSLTKYEVGEDNPTPIAVKTGSVYSVKAKVDDPENSAIELVRTGGTTTGIENVSCEATPADNRIYNIYGIEVDENYRGLVIRNGKKLIVR